MRCYGGHEWKEGRGTPSVWGDAIAARLPCCFRRSAIAVDTKYGSTSYEKCDNRHTPRYVSCEIGVRMQSSRTRITSLRRTQSDWTSHATHRPVVVRADKQSHDATHFAHNLRRYDDRHTSPKFRSSSLRIFCLFLNDIW